MLSSNKLNLCIVYTFTEIGKSAQCYVVHYNSKLGGGVFVCDESCIFRVKLLYKYISRAALEHAYCK